MFFFFFFFSWNLENIADAYLFKLIDEILNYIDNNDNKVILRLCYNIILNFIRNGNIFYI